MNKNEIYTAFFIAKKNLIKNKGILIFTILIISLGFISSTIIYGVLKDTGYDMQENFIETTIGHIVLEPYSVGQKIQNADNILKKTRELPNVVGVAKISKKNARIYDRNNNHIDTEIYIVNPNSFADISVVDDIIWDGSWLSRGEKDKIVIGCVNIKNCNEIKAFNTLDVNVGGKTKVVFSGYGEFELFLKGIYNHNFIQTEFISYINEDTAKELFPDYDSNTADLIVIRLSDRKHTEKVVNELYVMNLQTKISDWKEKSSMHSSIIDSFMIIGDLSFIIGVIISAISIYVILYINILNKKTQIGIIKAIGIKSKVIALSYIILSLFLGIVGALLGVLLTMLMTQIFNLYPIKTGVGALVPQISIVMYVVVALAIVVASVISGYIVSKRITKQNIIGAISHG
jgi:putative ABC transport system permease protein